MNHGLRAIKTRIYALVEETGVDLGRLLDAVHLAFDDVEDIMWEKLELIELVDQESGDRILEAIDQAIGKRGTVMGDILGPREDSRGEITGSHVELALSYLKDKIKELAKETGIDPMYFIEKVFESLDNIQLFLEMKRALASMEGKGEKWLTLKECEDELLQKGELEKPILVD